MKIKSKSPGLNPNQRPSSIAADLIASALKRHGVEVMFSQSLPTRVVLACADAGIRQVPYRTENAGGAMADGYARQANKIGVVCAQNGPAATLLVPPLAEALKSSVPILALVQEVNRQEIDRNAFQEFDHLALFRSCTKWVRQVWQAGRVGEYVDMAITAATTGRPGPSVLLLPADMLNETVAPPSRVRSAKLGHWPMDRALADPETIARVAQMIAAAEAPVVIAGGGVHGAKASKEIAELQEKISLPVATTTMGKGAVDERHSLSLGLVGHAMGRRSLGKFIRPLIDAADVVLLVGTRTNQNGTDSWRLLPRSATIIHLDVDGQEVGRNYDCVRLVGDAKLTLRALIKALSKQDISKRQATRAGIASRISQARKERDDATEDVRTSNAQPIRPERIMQEIDVRLTPETTLVADASYSSVWITTYLWAQTPGMRFLTPRGLAGLGWGVPMAIGAKLARAHNPVICITGDGGFGHVWSELETVVRENVPITIIVLNNGVLGYQKDAEILKFGRHTRACHFKAVDHVSIARACGCAAERIENPADVGPALEAAFSNPGPTLIDAITDPNAFPPLTMYDGTPNDPPVKPQRKL